MKKLHWQLCEAPICADESCYKDQPKWKKEVLWYPGERVCQRRPFTKWQKRQAKINRWHEKGLFKHGDSRYFTVEMLTDREKVMRGTKGGNPDARQYDRAYYDARKRIKP